MGASVEPPRRRYPSPAAGYDRDVAASDAWLFTPSLHDHPGAVDARAWRPRHLFWVALLGGIVPTAVLASVNSRRLALPRASVRRTVAACVIAVAAWAGLSLQANVPLEGFLVWDRVFALVLHVVVRRVHVKGDRAYHFYRDGEWSYASIRRAAALAIGGALAIQALAVAALVFS